ncbi:MAG: hypothetical protein ACP5O0_10400, partial [Acidimicrobiales bacterium]
MIYSTSAFGQFRATLDRLYVLTVDRSSISPLVKFSCHRGLLSDTMVLRTHSASDSQGSDLVSLESSSIVVFKEQGVWQSRGVSSGFGGRTWGVSEILVSFLL